jgi:hypothetical protein
MYIVWLFICTPAHGKRTATMRNNGGNDLGKNPYIIYSSSLSFFSSLQSSTNRELVAYFGRLKDKEYVLIRPENIMISRPVGSDVNDDGNYELSNVSVPDATRLMSSNRVELSQAECNEIFKQDSLPGNKFRIVSAKLSNQDHANSTLISVL